MQTGESRGFLEDGDEIILRAWCEAEGARGSASANASDGWPSRVRSGGRFLLLARKTGVRDLDHCYVPWLIPQPVKVRVDLGIFQIHIARGQEIRIEQIEPAI